MNHNTWFGPVRLDLPLLKAVARACRWSQDLLAGHLQSVGDVARREGAAGRCVRELKPLRFLAPRIVEAIVEGRQPPELTMFEFTRRIDRGSQEQALGLR